MRSATSVQFSNSSYLEFSLIFPPIGVGDGVATRGPRPDTILVAI